MTWGLLANSLLVSLGTTVLSASIGFMAALWLAALRPSWRNRLLMIAIVALVMPPFLATNCWLHFLGLTGVWRHWLPLNIYSLGGTIWILTLLNWPISLLPGLSALQRVEPAHLESDPALRGVALVRLLLWPMARVSLVQAAVLTFVLALNNFAVPAILQVKVFPAEIWVQFSTNFSFRGALVLSWPLIIAPVLLWLMLRHTEIQWPRRKGPAVANALRRQLGPVWFAGCGVVTVAALALSVALPLLQILAVERTWTELPKVFRAVPSVLWNSFFFSALTACACIGIALATGTSGLQGGKRIWSLLWLPLLLPGVLLGVALIWIFNRPVFDGLYRSTGIIVIAWTIRYLAIGWNGLALAAQSADRDLTDAARLDGAKGWSLLRYVVWPQIAPQAAAAGYVTYLLCLWDVETLVLIYPPGGETLALRIFNLLHYGHNAQVNALSLLLLVLAVTPLGMWNSYQWFRTRQND